MRSNAAMTGTRCHPFGTRHFFDPFRGHQTDGVVAGPLGVFDSDGVGWTIGANAQLRDPREYRDIVVKSANGAVTLLGSIASIELSTRNSRSAPSTWDSRWAMTVSAMS